MEIERVWNIDGYGLVSLINNTIIDTVYLERGNLCLVSHNLYGPIKVHITILNTDNLWSYHIKFVTFFNITNSSLAY